jgi:DNA-directed RNA polymerase specialized sigma24 family protein
MQAAMSDPRHRYLGDPGVIARLRSSLARRVDPADLDDAAQTTMTAALEAGSYPEDLEAFERWLHQIGRAKVIDGWRRRRARERHLGKPLEPLDGEGNADPVDSLPAPSHGDSPEVRDGLHFARGLLEAQAARRGDERPVRWLLKHAAGHACEDLAEEDGVPKATVEQAISRLRRRLRAAGIVAAVLAAFALVGGLLGRKPKNEEARPAPSAAPSLLAPPPAPIAPDPERERLQAVERVRDQARDECDRGEWVECVSDLDRARAEDPAGDLAPGVQELRHKAQSHLPSDGKPRRP